MKKVGNSMYVHKSALDTLPAVKQVRALQAFLSLPAEFEYDIIKVKGDDVTFIQSPNWNSADEPDVGESYLVKPDGSYKHMKPRGQIYHHKWMFVKPNYSGFDVEESKKRSETWEKALKRLSIDMKFVKSRIGKKEYWENLLKNLRIFE